MFLSSRFLSCRTRFSALSTLPVWPARACVLSTADFIREIGFFSPDLSPFWRRLFLFCSPDSAPEHDDIALVARTRVPDDVRLTSTCVSGARVPQLPFPYDVRVSSTAIQTPIKLFRVSSHTLIRELVLSCPRPSGNVTFVPRTR